MPTKKEIKKDNTVGFRLTQPLKNIIAEIAEKETRSVSQQVEHFVKKGIETYLAENPKFKDRLKSTQGLETGDLEL